MKPTGVIIIQTDQPEASSLITKVVINDGEDPLNWRIEVSDTIENTLETNWSNTTEVGVEQTIEIDAVFARSTTTLKFNQIWQKGGAEIKRETIGTNEAIELKGLPYGTRKRLDYMGWKLSAKAIITYDVYLDGLVFCNYKDSFKAPSADSKHHFYGVRIEDILATNGVSNLQTVVQETKFDYARFSYSRISDEGAADQIEPHVIAVDPNIFVVADAVDITE